MSPFCVLLLLLGQTGGNPFLAKAERQIRELDEKGALRTLEEASRWTKNTPADLAQVQLLLGLAHSGLSNERAAVASFRQALLLDPGIELPARVSPRVRGWWVKAGGRLPPQEKEPEPPPVLTPLNPAPAPAEPAPPVVVLAPVPTPAPPAPPPSHAGRWVAGALLVLGAVAASAGVVRGVQAQSWGRQANSAQAPDVATAQSLHVQSVSAAQSANILYAVGGGLALSGGAVLLAF